MAAPTLHVDVVSAEEQIYSGEAEFVVLPGIEGELGVYPRHTPLFTQIRPGAVRIKRPGDLADEFVFVQGGTARPRSLVPEAAQRGDLRRHRGELALRLGEVDIAVRVLHLSLIHISEPTRPLYISYAVFCLKKFFF